MCEKDKLAFHNLRPQTAKQRKRIVSLFVPLILKGTYPQQTGQTNAAPLLFKNAVKDYYFAATSFVWI